MAIPDYQTVMLPLLNTVSDGKPHRIRDMFRPVCEHFDLTDEERQRLLPSGKMTVIRNRVHWAKLYLVRAGLLEVPERGVILISSRGQELLASNPKRVDNAILKQYAEFVAFTQLKSERSEQSSAREEVSVEQTVTPDEALEDAFGVLQESLADEVLGQIRAVTPGFFEKLVVDLLVGMGYGGAADGSGTVVGKSGDGGIDGIIKEDRLGLGLIYVQAKRQKDNVGRPKIQEFAGALQGRRATKGVFITTSSFTREAREYIKSIDCNIVLIDGVTLAELMIESNVGVSTVETYLKKRIDTDYFAEE
jgi:restriction system protein